MKHTKRIDCFFRNFKIMKYTILYVTFLVLFIEAIVLNVVMKTAPKDIIDTISIFDLLACPSESSSAIGKAMLVFPVIPAFIYLLIKLIDLDNEVFSLIRNNSKNLIWNKMLLYTFLMSLIFAVVMILGGYIVSGLILGNFNNDWVNSNSYIYSLFPIDNPWENLSNYFITTKLLFKLSISYFLGFSMIGMLVCFLKNYLKNIYVYLVIEIIIISDWLLNLPLIFNKMTIKLSEFCNPTLIFANCMYMIFIIMFFYIVGKGSFNRKDFY